MLLDVRELTFSPLATLWFKFITKKAELMCEWMRHGAYNPHSKVTKVRRYALDLMMYRGSDSDYAAAVLVVYAILHETSSGLLILCLYSAMCMDSINQLQIDCFKGISKETKMICECLRQGTQVETLRWWSKAIIENGWDILWLLHDECISSGNGNGTATTKAGNATQYDQFYLISQIFAGLLYLCKTNILYGFSILRAWEAL